MPTPSSLEEFYNDAALMERIHKQTEQYHPYLYILMRNDMESMNPGKAVAQGAHAANAFVFNVMQRWNASWNNTSMTLSPTQKDLFIGWQGSSLQGFGVTICLEVNGDQLEGAVSIAQRSGFIAGIAHDPSYPIRDGKVVHLLPLNTCGWVFGPKHDLVPILSQFDLHP